MSYDVSKFASVDDGRSAEAERSQCQMDDTKRLALKKVPHDPKVIINDIISVSSPKAPRMQIQPLCGATFITCSLFGIVYADANLSVA